MQACILYRDFEHGEVLRNMLCLLKGRKDGFMDLTEQERLFYDSMHGLVEMAGFYGFYGNLWHDYLTFLLVNKENAFSMACEIVGPVEGSINEIAKGDFAVFKELYECDLEVFDQELGSAYGQIISDYQNVAEGSRRFNRRIRDRICSLSQKLAQADSVDTFMEDMVEFYRDFGVGTLGLHKAFRVGHDGDGQVVIQPITNIAHVHLDDLVGYEIAKKKLIDNTEAFVEGRICGLYITI